MTQSNMCPKCAAPLPENAPAGICPTCLMQAGLASEGASPTKPATLVSGFVPPEPNELAKNFPQLEILELIGKGGMGAVYKARQRGLGRIVALKVLPPEIADDASFTERFTREARALGQLSHNHIVSVYDFGQANGLFFIVMEFVDGINLRQTIQSGRLSPADALAIVPQICEALQFAHDEGIVHRDIKPENILIDKKGRVKIADFGLAKLLGQDGGDHWLTGTHQVMGTLRYMAPEQMQGSREIDHRADIYSLGVVFYELLTGELPMGKFAPPSKRVQVDVRLDEIVLRALEQQPEQRYQHASEVKTDVDALVRSGAPAKQPSRAALGDKVTMAERAWDSTDVLVRLVRSLWPGIIIYCATVAFILLLLFVTGRPGQRAEEFQRHPEISWVILLLPGLVVGLVASLLFSYQQGFFVRSVTMNGAGLTMHSGTQPSRFLKWDEITGLPAFREHWWGCASSSVASARDWFGIDSSLGCRRYFRPSDRLAFAAAIDRFAPPDAGWAEALRAEAASVARQAQSEPPSFAGTKPGSSPATSLQIRRQLTAPAIALMLYGLLVLLPALLCLTNGLDIADGNDGTPAMVGFGLIAVSLLLVVLSGLMMRGGWHMLAVENYRAALLGSFLGQPIGMWGLIVLSRSEVKSAFPTVSRERTQTGPVDHPPLVLVLATLDLFAAVALLLLLYNAKPYPESMSPLWHRWSQVEIALGFIGGVGLFVASISLLLWQPWARKLILGVCFLFMAQWLIAMPDLTQVAFPAACEEVRQQALSKGYPVEEAQRVASLAAATGFGILFVIGLTWLLGHLVYFTRPRVVAAFEGRSD